MVDPMLSSDILAGAAGVVADRSPVYGKPLANHLRTANLWSTYLGKIITPEDVCMLNILQKISRGMNEISHDTLVDICGYAKNIQLIKLEKHDGSRVTEPPGQSRHNHFASVPTERLRKISDIISGGGGFGSMQDLPKTQGSGGLLPTEQD
jgi:hypothetical protein